MAAGDEDSTRMLPSDRQTEQQRYICAPEEVAMLGRMQGETILTSVNPRGEDDEEEEREGW